MGCCHPARQTASCNASGHRDTRWRSGSGQRSARPAASRHHPFQDARRSATRWTPQRDQAQHQCQREKWRVSARPPRPGTRPVQPERRSRMPARRSRPAGDPQRARCRRVQASRSREQRFLPSQAGSTRQQEGRRRAGSPPCSARSWRAERRHHRRGQRRSWCCRR